MNWGTIEMTEDTNNNPHHGSRHYHMGNEDDPTQNVLDIIQAESKYQDGMRDAQARLDASALASQTSFQNLARDNESRLQSWMRDAETNRVDQLTAQRQSYEAQIA